MICACSTPLNLVDINNLNKLEFGPLFISSECELFDLRIDIIRQTYKHQVNDSTSETRKVPYHKLGFNLGNGLFYDLNDNLSFRIDYLLNIDTNSDFVIEKTYARKNRKRIISYTDGNYRIQGPKQNRNYTKLKIDSFEDSLSIFNGNRFRYAITKNDTSLAYSNKKKILDKIRKKEDNYYCQIRGKRVDEYRYENNEIVLDNKYKVLLNPDRKIVEIKRMRKDTNIPLYKIIRDANTIFIYNRKNYGKKIVLNEGEFTLYHNKQFGYTCKSIE